MGENKTPINLIKGGDLLKKVAGINKIVQELS